MREEYNKHIDEQEKKRAEERAGKEQRMQDIMNRMANTVVKQ